MRTTLTLDEDVYRTLRSESRKSGRSFREVVNEYLRLGMNTRRKAAEVPPYRVKARDMGQRPGLNFDCISELLEQIEGPLHR